MHSTRSSTALALVSLVLLAGLLTGCGGGGGEQDGGSQQNGGGGQQGDKKAQKSAPETSVAIGTVGRINPENNRRIVVKVNQGEDKKAEPEIFKIRENAQITLDGKKAEVGDVAEGQQAQVEYITKKETNRVLSLRLFRAEGQTSGGEGTSN